MYDCYAMYLEGKVFDSLFIIFGYSFQQIPEYDEGSIQSSDSVWQPAVLIKQAVTGLTCLEVAGGPRGLKEEKFKDRNNDTRFVYE